MNLNDVKQAFRRYRIKEKIIKQIDMADLLSSNSGYFKSKPIKTKSITRSLFNSATEYPIASFDTCVYEIANLTKREVERVKKEIEEEYGENLLSISDVSLTNYANLKLTTTVEYIIEDKNEMLLSLVETMIKEKTDISYSDKVFSISLGLYTLKLDVSDYPHQRNFGNMLNKAKRMKCLGDVLNYFGDIYSN